MEMSLCGRGMLKLDLRRFGTISCLAELIYDLINRQFLCRKRSQTGDDSIFACGMHNNTTKLFNGLLRDGFTWGGASANKRFPNLK